MWMRRLSTICHVCIEWLVLQGSELCVMGKGQSCDRGVIHLTV